MRMVALGLAVGSMLAACGSGGLDVPTSQHLQGEHADQSGALMRYLVWLPEDYGVNRDHLHPMIVYLHGSGNDTYDSEFVIGFGLPAVLASADQPSPFDFVVLSPQAEPGSTWTVGDQLEVVQRVVDSAVDTYLVDPNRVYLTGMSMGGYAAWHLATRHPDRYAAMISVSGSGYQLATLPPEEYSCRLSEVPVKAVHGIRDRIADYEPIRVSVDAWEDLCGTTVDWVTYPDAGHFEAPERIYRDPDLYRWMLDQP